MINLFLHLSNVLDEAMFEVSCMLRNITVHAVYACGFIAAPTKAFALLSKPMTLTELARLTHPDFTHSENSL